MKRVIKVILVLILLILLIIVGFVMKDIFFARSSDPVIDKTKVVSTNGVYECLVFDGMEIVGATTLIIEDGKIVNEIVIEEKEDYNDLKYFLMPGITDAHTHIDSEEEINKMINNGVVGAYDVASSKILSDSVDIFNMRTSTTTIMPGFFNGESKVDSLVNQGAEYIKVMIDMPKIMGGSLIDKKILQDIVSTSHKNNLKVAAHVTTIEATKLAVASGVDILVHVPIGEEFPESLAKEIFEKNISVIPTLVMMKEFANSSLYGFKKSDYQDAENAVKLLNSYNVPILVGTDSNNSYFVPKVEHGKSLYDEMELLIDAGLTPKQVLQGTTRKITDAYGLEDFDSNFMVLIEGRPDQNIKDITNIRQIWIDNEPVFYSGLEKNKILGDDVMNNEDLIFIPKHPSSIKTHQIETKDSVLLEQTEPISSKKLYSQFINDFDNSLNRYQDKRFEVIGTAIKIGPDIHNKPSIEISSDIDERCHILCVFANNDIYDNVSVGDEVIVRGNYLVMSNWYGIVLKKCELIYN